MGHEVMSLTGFLSEMKDVTNGPHPRKFCFVIGAGASRSSGIKSGQELVDIWDKELEVRNSDGHKEWKESLGITSENKYSFYSQYYDRRFKRELADGYNYMEKLMEHAKPSAGYVMLAYLLSKTPHNVVVTTNFDHLIEDAVSYYSQGLPLVIGHEALAHYLPKKITRPTIVKIHRDLLLAPKSTTGEVEELHDNWVNVLEAVFSEYHPIFIGYAGNDKSLMNFLNKNAENFKNSVWRFPYWMLYKSDSLSGKVLELVDNADGYVIRHEGFDQTLYRMGTALEYRIPEEEQFLNDARKRYETLSNSINEFTREYLSKTTPHSDDKNSTEKEEQTSIDQAIRQVTDQSELLQMYRHVVELHNGGRYDEAIPIERELINRSPESARYRDVYGVTLHEMGQYDEALATKSKAVKLEPNNAQYLNSLGVTLHKMGRYGEALTMKTKAVELEPDNAFYQDSLSVTLIKMDCYNKALDASTKAIELEPNNARYLNNFGEVLYGMGRYDEALAAKRRAVELEPTDALCQNSLGAILHRMGLNDEALIALRKATELKPDEAIYQSNFGIVLHSLGRYAEALAAKRRAVELDPDNEMYQNGLKATLEKL